MKTYFLIFLFSFVFVKSQLQLNIKSTDGNNYNKMIIMEITNSSNIAYKIPIDTSNFNWLYQRKNYEDLKPYIDLKYRNKSIKSKNNVAELSEDDLAYANRGNKIPIVKNKIDTIEVMPNSHIKFTMQLNPFEFNFENGKYNYFDIKNNLEYSLLIYIENRKNKHIASKKNITKDQSAIFTGVLRSNSIKIKWDLRKIKKIKW